MTKKYIRKKDDPSSKETPDYLGPDSPEIEETSAESHNFPRYKLRTFPEKHDFPRYKLRTKPKK